MKKRWQALSGIVLCSSLILSACSSNGGSNTPSNGAAATPDSGGGAPAAEERANITWMNFLHTASPPTDTVMDEIQRITNTNLKISWIPDASKDERLNTALASGSLADIVTLPNLESSSIRNALKAGVFWEISHYMDEFPNLAAISKDLIRSASIEGNLYGVPLIREMARNGVIIRKDWLDNLGLDVPRTTDDLFEVAKAFTENDPDGNGVADTTGFIDRSDLVFGVFKTISSYFGTPSNWAVSDDGVVTPEFESEGYIKTMDFMKELYDNAYINQDFAVTAKVDQQEKFAQGKAGIYVGALFDSRSLRTMAEGIQDQMELVMVNDITSTGNEADRAIWTTSNGVGGMLAFPKSEVKDETELKRVLRFVDDMLSEEIYALMTYGIEGVHYTLEGSIATIINMDKFQQDVQPLRGTRVKDHGYEIREDNELVAKAAELILENGTFVVINPMVGLESPTFSSQGSELQKLITDATYKYILGQINLEQFNQEVGKWRKAGGNEIIAEFEAAYKA